MRKPRKTSHLLLLLLATSLPCMIIAWRFTAGGGGPHAPHSVSVKVQLEGAKDRADLVQNDDGSYSYIVQRAGADDDRLSPDQLAERQFRQQSSGGWLRSVFNISSPLSLIWIGVGLFGQVLFTGRMVIQWLATEKNRKSVVPPMFWWMSLIGALMLLAYFLWRRDIVGVLGQSFGLIVYVRNLYFIYSERRALSIGEDPAPEPELAAQLASSPRDAFNQS